MGGSFELRLASVGEAGTNADPIRTEGEAMTIDVHITIGGNGGSAEAGESEQAFEPSKPAPAS